MENEMKLDYTELSPRELALVAVRALYGKQGFDVKLYHVEDATIITDYYVICTGRSTTHVKALADEACYRLDLGGVHAAHVEGRETGTWILLDFGSVIAHVFSRDDRDYYKLERLLPEGTEVDITDFLAQLDREAKG
ncbi:MAG: ribosome silencing factor [Clostridia bacterium]|nr:ribosome silencing factor [Clostridia bacterium]